jgi:hypothetical protein
MSYAGLQVDSVCINQRLTNLFRANVPGCTLAEMHQRWWLPG